MNPFCELSTTMDAILGTKDTQTAIYIFMTTENVTSLLTYRWYRQCIILSKQPTFTKSHNWNSYFTQEDTFHMSFKWTPYLLQTFTFQVSTIICVSTSFTFMETKIWKPQDMYYTRRTSNTQIRCTKLRYLYEYHSVCSSPKRHFTQLDHIISSLCEAEKQELEQIIISLKCFHQDIPRRQYLPWNTFDECKGLKS